MAFRDIPIRKKLMRLILLISGMVLLVTCITFFVYEFYTFRKTTIEKVATIGKIISSNSTAALAFENHDDAKEILAALKTEPHIVAGCIYDKNGNVFAQYVTGNVKNAFPQKPGAEGYHFSSSYLDGFQPVIEGSQMLGTLYLKSDLGAMYERFGLYGIVVVLVVVVSILLVYLLSPVLGRSISTPILDLAETAKGISNRKDYSVRAVKAGNDELGSLTDAFNDMLSQIEMQNHALNEFAQNLEQKVKDRTAQLEAVNKELEAFSYSISHDLRAPLRGIIGFATILEEDYSSKLDEEARRITAIIKKNTLKMGHLIDDLLAFSRMGRQDIVKTTIHTATMVEEVIKEVVPEGKRQKIEWTIQDLPDMMGDINAIRQVWVNLVSNAVKYSGKNENPSVEIGFFAQQGQTVFFVKDNGVGFDGKYKEKLFKVFQRLHAADDFEGTGVGLAIVEKVISKHGGKVWAESELRKGASFYFSVPNE